MDMGKENSDSFLQVSAVYKKFGAKQVLKGVDFTIQAGEVTALLGHNGAGKTTLLRILLGLLDIDSGSVNVFGKDPISAGEEIRKISGVLSEDTGLYESLSVYDNLKFFAEVYGCQKSFYEERMDELLTRFDILETKHQVIKNFSMGMKKKVSIIRTILHNPKLILFDEPVNSLDPVSVTVLHDIIQEMKEKYHTTFVITTHNLDEVMKICDKIVIIKGGKSVVQKTLGMKSYLRTNIELLNEGEEENVKRVLRNYPTEYTIQNRELILNQVDRQIISDVIKDLVYHQIPICSVVRDHFDLTKLYMEVEEDKNE